MTNLETRTSPIAEILHGCSTLEIARSIVGKNPAIDQVYFQKYTGVHNRLTLADENVISLARRSFVLGNELNNMISGLAAAQNLSFNSLIRTTAGNNYHFPLIDLSVEKNKTTQAAVEAQLLNEVVPVVGGGFLIETGKSYQFFGKYLITPQQWLKFITWDHSLFDCNYTYYCRKRGFSGLRLTTNYDKSFVPKVVAAL